MGFDFAGLLERPPGGWPCAGCGKPIDWPGVCDTCAESRDRERAKDLASDAISTIPARFRWATFEADEMPQRAACVDKARSAAELLRDGKLQVVVLVGRAGTGKTSLACAMMRRLLNSRVGRTSKFVGALSLARARSDATLGRTPALVDDAVRASLLLLDDLGQETQADVIREVVHARHDADVPLIVTSGTSPTKYADRYGAGTARRLTERAALIELGAPNAA